MRAILPSSLAVFCLAFAGSPSSTCAAGVAPGPTVMSDEEKAIRADPAQGVEHAVILLEESERNDDLGTVTETRFHLRAKILSSEGRDLANVQQPFLGRLQSWWGRTILPDGTVLELKEEDLPRRPGYHGGWAEYGQFRAALPGVVPGCVIDYGYVTRLDLAWIASRLQRVPLQRPWPIREIRFRWKPHRYLKPAWRLARTDGLDIAATRDGDVLKISGHSIPPILSEPMMPADPSVRAAVTIYYPPPGIGPKGFWRLEAKRIERDLREFLGDGAAIRDAVAELRLAADVGPEARIRAAYEFVRTRVKNTRNRSFEEEQVSTPRERDARDRAAYVLAQREGDSWQIDELFAGLVRALGAEAYMVLTSDRTEHPWDPELYSTRQFDTSLVAILEPGRPDSEISFAAPSSGLSFGELPWWTTGADGFLARPESSGPIAIPPSAADRNVSRTIGSLRFDADGSSLDAEWTLEAEGQSGFSYRSSLRRMSPEDRRRWREDACGAGSAVEELQAQTPGLDDASAPFRLSCRRRRQAAELGPSVGRYALSWGGPWVQATPSLPSGRRTQPVVFNFPTLDVIGLDIDAPPGFAAKEKPPAIQLETPYGRYSLEITVTPRGFHVERSFSLLPLSVPAGEYEALRAFLSEVRRADSAEVVFERREDAR